MTSSGSPQLPHVLVLDDTQGRRALILDAATYSLGRDPQNSIPLRSSSISRQHALLLRVPDKVVNPVGTASGSGEKPYCTILFLG